jgi:hypothetical protein
MRLTPLTIRLIPIALPFAAAWVRFREREALATGIPLDAVQLSDARAVGIREPEKVRLLRVPAIHVFRHPLLAPISWLTRKVFGRTAGITLGHGILIRTDCWGERRLVIHELTHVAQYERLGGIGPFLRRYFRECLLEGYPNGELEREASAAAARLAP